MPVMIAPGSLVAYGTQAQLAEYIDAAGNAGQSARVGNLLMRASRFVDRQTASYFGATPSATVALFNGSDMPMAQAQDSFYGLVPGGSAVLFPSWPIVSLTAVELAPYTGGAFVAVDPTQWFLEPDQPAVGMPYTRLALRAFATIIGSASWFYEGRQNVRLTGVFGYPAVPDDIVHLTLKIAARWWKAKDAGWSGVMGSIDTGLITVKTLDSEDRAILQSHYKVSVF